MYRLAITNAFYRFSVAVTLNSDNLSQATGLPGRMKHSPRLQLEMTFTTERTTSPAGQALYAFDLIITSRHTDVSTFETKEVLLLGTRSATSDIVRPDARSGAVCREIDPITPRSK